MSYQVGQVIGMAVGSFFGGPFGAMLGSMVMGAILPPPKVQQTGPRLSDLSIQTAAYGKAIPEVFGVVRLAGNIIAGNKLREVKKNDSSKKGPSTTTFSYYGTVAISLCRGPVRNVRRLWADGVLIFDASSYFTVPGQAPATAHRPVSSEDPKFAYNPSPNADGAIQLTPHIKFYPGTEEQHPSAVLEAFLGVGQVPAFRGIAYLLLNDQPLEAFGNRIPTIEAEVDLTEDSDEKVSLRAIIPGPSGIQASYNGLNGTIDTRAGVRYSVNGQTVVATNLTTGAIQELSAANSFAFSLFCVFYNPFTDCLVLGGRAVGNDGLLYATNYALARSELTTATATGGFNLIAERARVFYYAGADGSLQLITNGYGIVCTPGSGAAQAASMAAYNVIQLVAVPDAAASGEDTGFFSQPIYPGLLRGEASNGITVAGDGTVWVIAGLSGSGIGLTQAARFQNGVIVGTVEVQSGTSLITGADGEVYGNSSSQIACYSIPRVVYAAGAGEGIRGVIAVGPQFAFVSEVQSATYITVINADGTVWARVSIGNIPRAPLEGYWPAGGVIAGSTVLAVLNKWQTVYPTVGSIFERLCERVGMPPELVDASRVKTDNYRVQGYALASRTTARAGFEGLQTIYGIDAIETQDVLRLQGRAEAQPSLYVPLTKQAMAPQGTAPVYTKGTRAEEVALPSTVEFGFADPALDYRDNLARAIRTTTASEQQFTFNHPIVMSNQRAIEVAEMVMCVKWLSRQNYDVQLGFEYAELDPGDAFYLETEGGYEQVIINRIRISPNGLLLLTVSQFEASIYGGMLSTPIGVASGGTLVPNYNPSWMPLDLPILKAEDDFAGIYLAAWHPLPSRSNSAVALISLDGNEGDWALLGQVDTLAAVGIVRGGDFVGTKHWLDGCDAVVRDDQSMTVQMVSGELYTATQNELLAGANTCAIARGSYYEVIQFKTATYLNANRYQLTGLVRGRVDSNVNMQGGTEPVQLDGTADNPTFFVLDANFKRLATPKELLLPNLAPMRVLSAGRTVDSSTSKGVEFGNIAQETLAVSNIKATTVAGDHLLTWTRNNRFNNGLRDKTDIPLVDGPESYDLEFHGASGASFAVNVSAPQYLLTSAQATSLGAYTLTIWQVGTAMGRGKPGFYTTP